ncbi:GNAT family N-acetyltransferase [Cytobacillus horneckiae]|uniref:GNAT family N-acetyltransferase n=1 Tax=Cytobacillus horneckiae TaxID=549687 RepID=UPI003D9A640B
MSILNEGVLKQGPSYVVTYLQEKDIKAIMALQEEVIAALDNKSVLQPLLEEEFKYILKGKGLLIGAWIGEKLIAFRALLVPPIDEEHLGLDVGIEDLSKVIYQEISNVHPIYRGNHLQQKLAAILMDELKKDEHCFEYVCSTVAPFNFPSLKDKLSQGMEIAALKEKYGGRLRYVFVMEIHRKEAVEWKKSQQVPMKNTALQQALLAEGWRGVGMIVDGENSLIDFRKS